MEEFGTLFVCTNGGRWVNKSRCQRNAQNNFLGRNEVFYVYAILH